MHLSSCTSLQNQWSIWVTLTETKVDKAANETMGLEELEAAKDAAAAKVLDHQRL